MWFRNKDTGLEWEVTHEDTIRNLKRKNNFEIIDKASIVKDTSSSNIDFVNADDYTVKELQEICREEDISGYSRKNQEELVELINDTRQKRADD